MTGHDSGGSLHRGLKRRHMTMIGIGGVISAGLFVSSGKVIAETGPAALVAYVLGGLIVILVMRMLGEMAAARPSAGSFADYAGTALGPRAGFLVGWCYWLFAIVAVAFEGVAGAKLLHSLSGDVPVLPTAVALLVALTAANLVSVRLFGETEFWLASAKVALIVAFLVAGALYVLGLWPSDGAGGGLSALTDHGGFAPKGWGAVLTALVTVLFSYFGAEIVTIAAAESAEPAKEVARATLRVVWRVLIFYVGSVLVILAVVPWNRVPANGTDSPFATAIAELGVPGAATLMTWVILVAVLSVMNAALYAASRVLGAMAARGDAPAAAARVRASGVPAPALLGGAALALVLMTAAFAAGDDAFDLLINTAGLLVLLLYVFVALSQLRLRRRMEAESPELLRLRMWGFPWLSRVVVALLVLAFAAVASSPEALPVVGAVAVAVGGTLLAYEIKSRREEPSDAVV
ncbi:amino acid permease [Actinomadura chibensis]|uniref:Amino acid permease n=2 Tax=Actinomadura chibensis TaxID=392828 RepID=A0A5D0NKP7_9ACTN|nr:amino acid permease [Actinomadura chibensis]